MSLLAVTFNAAIQSSMMYNRHSYSKSPSVELGHLKLGKTKTVLAQIIIITLISLPIGLTVQLNRHSTNRNTEHPNNEFSYFRSTGIGKMALPLIIHQKIFVKKKKIVTKNKCQHLTTNLEDFDNVIAVL